MMDSTGRTVQSVSAITRGPDALTPAFTDETGVEKPVSSIGETGNFTFYDQYGRAYVSETKGAERSNGYIESLKPQAALTAETDRKI